MKNKKDNKIKLDLDIDERRKYIYNYNLYVNYINNQKQTKFKNKKIHNEFNDLLSNKK